MHKEGLTRRSFLMGTVAGVATGLAGCDSRSSSSEGGVTLPITPEGGRMTEKELHDALKILGYDTLEQFQADNGLAKKGLNIATRAKLRQKLDALVARGSAI